MTRVGFRREAALLIRFSLPKDTKAGTQVANCTEPFAVTIRHIAPDNVKIIYWFITEVAGEHQDGTSMPSEFFESCWFEADEAVEKLTYEHDREVARQAVDLVREELDRHSLAVQGT